MGEVIRPRVSYSDLVQQPEDGRRYEIYDGEVFVVPSPLPLHQIVADNIARLLHDYSKVHGGLAITAPLDIVFSEHDVLQPDVVFFCAARRYLVDLHEPIRSAPDLVVEVLSPSTEATDRGRKLQMFARYEVAEYWIVNPDEPSIEVLRLIASRYELQSLVRKTGTVRSATLPAWELLLETVIPE